MPMGMSSGCALGMKLGLTPVWQTSRFSVVRSGRKGILPTMPKFYSEQFKREAVALYENNENLSLAAAAVELGVNRA